MAIKKERQCVVCEEAIHWSDPPNKIYCSRACASKRYYQRKRAKKMGERKKDKWTHLTPAMREFRSLINEQDPFVRETLQQAIRDVVTEAVGDNLTGAGEIITGLLPKTLAGIAVDLDSSDWMIRSRAQQMVMKYAMEFKDKDKSDTDLGNITVVHSVALPGTPLGRATAGEIQTIEAESHDSVIEYFERDWPVCVSCGDRKHPDAMYDAEDIGLRCSSCHLSAAFHAEQEMVE